MYIDGELRASCNGTGIPSSDNYQDLSIGCTFGYIGPPPGGIEPPIWFFPGNIDEPTIWNITLSHEQIVDLFISNIDINSPELIGYWTFDESVGQIVSDLSLAGNNGYLGNSPEIDNSDPLWDFIIQGDINGDDSVDILDVVMLVNYILSGDTSELDGADINNDGEVNILDIVALVNIILSN